MLTKAAPSWRAEFLNKGAEMKNEDGVMTRPFVEGYKN
jgi:hypothetical protein